MTDPLSTTGITTEPVVGLGEGGCFPELINKCLAECLAHSEHSVYFALLLQPWGHRPSSIKSLRRELTPSPASSSEGRVSSPEEAYSFPLNLGMRHAPGTLPGRSQDVPPHTHTGSSLPTQARPCIGGVTHVSAGVGRGPVSLRGKALPPPPYAPHRHLHPRRVPRPLTDEWHTLRRWHALGQEQLEDGECQQHGDAEGHLLT